MEKVECGFDGGKYVTKLLQRYYGDQSCLEMAEVINIEIRSI